ncbi:MAG: sugar phosphate isomerase/epimerase [Candidatus Omnitrophota bacterium]
MDFVLSTSWNAFRHAGAQGLLFEIKELGFSEIELSFNLSSPMVGALLKAVKSGRIKVMSLHNFCPIPRGLDRRSALPDYYNMASTDEKERRLAVKYTKVTIDTASRLGAKIVVLHCGRVEVPDKTRSLIGLYQKGLNNSNEFKELKENLIKERKAFQAPFFENALKSLEELSGYALKRKVALGIETRFYYREIPSLEEIGIILGKFNAGNVFYWHDTGHAQVTENLGLANHRQYLELYGARLAGMHLHDVTGCADHEPPGKGEIDFTMLKPYIKKDTLKVIEAHHPASAEEIKESSQYLKRLLDGAG